MILSQCSSCQISAYVLQKLEVMFFFYLLDIGRQGVQPFFAFSLEEIITCSMYALHFVGGTSLRLCNRVCS